MATIDIAEAQEEFAILKTEGQQRNLNYYLLRQAVEGKFRWPRDWPNHIPKVKHNFCKPITDRFSTFLMGKGFTYNVDRPNTLEFRETAERTEKILARLMDLSKGNIQMMTGAQVGSVTGRSVFKVYKKGSAGHEHACFKACMPDYFYGIKADETANGEWAKVYYSYPIARSEAERLFGPGPYKSEGETNSSNRYDPLPEDAQSTGYYASLRLRIPVLEVWTRDAYALIVGEKVVFNGDNPYKFSNTDEGFIPYVVIENMRNDGQVQGESDIDQSRELNEHYNYLLSRKQYVVGRWLQPTLVWEGAPQNYLEVLTSTIGGGGAIPTRIGSRLYFLAYDRANPEVGALELSLRQAILETAGLNEIAFQGTVHGYVNSGTSVGAQYQPVSALIDKKRQYWKSAIAALFAMLLEVQEQIGDSQALGVTVINASVSSRNGSDGDVVQLSGKDIAGLRDVTIDFPGILPKDDKEAAQLELQKSQQGLQSFYTTLEKLGTEYPDDELARIREENTDPALKGQAVAEQTRANAMQTTAEANAASAGAPAPGAPQPGVPGMPEAPPDGPPLDDHALAQQGNVGARLRQLARNAQPQIQNTGGEPVIGPGGH